MTLASSSSNLEIMSFGVDSGITIVAGSPSIFATYADAMPAFPPEEETTCLHPLSLL